MAKTAKRTKQAPEDRFESVAKSLGCDEDKGRFESKLGKIAKAKLPGKWKTEQVKRGSGFKAVFVPSVYGPSREGPTFATLPEAKAWVSAQNNSSKS